MPELDEDEAIIKIVALAAAALVHLGTGAAAGTVLNEAKQYEAHVREAVVGQPSGN